VVVALPTEDNADRISVFNVTRLMLPGSALRSPIVFMFPITHSRVLGILKGGKDMRLAGVDTLILRGLEPGTFSVAREWTDWADPDPYSALGLPPRRWDLDLLLDLANLLEQLSSKSSRASGVRHEGQVGGSRARRGKANCG
jgi:Family of unknown function (DUF5372)